MTTDQWHIPAEVLAAYAAESASEADAWSTEAHVTRCARCRVDLTALVDAGPLQREVADARTQVLLRVGPRDTVPAPDLRRRTGVLMLVLRGPWVTAVLTALLMALLAEFTATRLLDTAVTLPMMALLGPVVPLAGISLCYRATDHGWAEAILATPSAGLRLVLWRVLAVLILAIPMTLAVSILTDGASAVLWLLPAAAMAAASLALGTVVELGRATGIVLTVWGIAVVAPAVVLMHVPWQVFSRAGQGVWGLLLTASIATVAIRREQFDRLPTWRPVAFGVNR